MFENEKYAYRLREDLAADFAKEIVGKQWAILSAFVDEDIFAILDDTHERGSKEFDTAKKQYNEKATNALVSDIEHFGFKYDVKGLWEGGSEDSFIIYNTIEGISPHAWHKRIGSLARKYKQKAYIIGYCIESVEPFKEGSKLHKVKGTMLYCESRKDSNSNDGITNGKNVESVKRIANGKAEYINIRKQTVIDFNEVWKDYATMMADGSVFKLRNGKSIYAENKGKPMPMLEGGIASSYYSTKNNGGDLDSYYRSYLTDKYEDNGTMTKLREMLSVGVN